MNFWQCHRGALFLLLLHVLVWFFSQYAGHFPLVLNVIVWTSENSSTPAIYGWMSEIKWNIRNIVLLQRRVRWISLIVINSGYTDDLCECRILAYGVSIIDRPHTTRRCDIFIDVIYIHVFRIYYQRFSSNVTVRVCKKSFWTNYQHSATKCLTTKRDANRVCIKWDENGRECFAY